MSKKKVGFNDKNNVQKFHLVYRSERDEAYAQEGTPSEMVLISAEELSSRPNRSTSTVGFTARKDHINELGFANDGYDYSQHLLELGSTYMDRSGNIVSNFTGKAVDLPDEVLPSTGELKRDYEAITISEELMDEDIRAALFDDNDEFEALDDDFVSQVMTEPEEPDFDFDAHIRNLLARSEEKLKLSDGTGKKNKGLTSIHENGEDDEGFFEVDEDLLQQMQEEGAVERIGDEQKLLLEAQLDKALEEYDDDDIGDLEEVDSDDLDGDIDLENDAAFNEALDEFIEQQNDVIRADRSNYRKGKRSTITMQTLLVDDDEDENHEPVDVKKEYQEQVVFQQQWEVEVRRIEQDNKVLQKEYMDTEDKLRQMRVKEEWDCETIISTYSTLDNHPTLVKNTNSKFKPYKTRYQRKMEADEKYINNINNQKRDGVKAAVEKHVSTSGKPDKIILGGKMNLPLDYVNNGANLLAKMNKREASSSLGARQVIKEEEVDENENSDKEEELDNDDPNEVSSTSSEEQDGRRSKKETADEKKARKAKVKEEKRLKRANKKALKTQFKTEGIKIVKNLAMEASTDHYTVYKY